MNNQSNLTCEVYERSSMLVSPGRLLSREPSQL